MGGSSDRTSPVLDALDDLPRVSRALRLAAEFARARAEAFEKFEQRRREIEAEDDAGASPASSNAGPPPDANGSHP
ncbi:MAG: hypothetical protein R3B68_14980 [Phycisphaerales bacterium]